MAHRTRHQIEALLQNIFGIVSDIRFLQIFGQIIFIIFVIFAVSGVINQIVSRAGKPQSDAELRLLAKPGGLRHRRGGRLYARRQLLGSLHGRRAQYAGRRRPPGWSARPSLGILGGIFLLSGNWLIRTITRFIVEILRNTPLLVQIFVWYFVVVLALPALQQSIQLPQAGLDGAAAALRCST